MTYLRYTFSIGFRLILACTFTMAFCCATALFFNEAWAAALWVLIGWTGLVLIRMFSAYIGYRRYKQFHHEP